MTNHSFNSYLDAMLVLIADQQHDQMTPIDLLDLHIIKFMKCPPTWAQLAGPEMERRGWGRMHRTFSREGFILEGAGVAHAHEVRTKLSKPAFARFVAGFTRSDWIAMAAAAMSLVALFKGG